MLHPLHHYYSNIVSFFSSSLTIMGLTDSVVVITVAIKAYMGEAKEVTIGINVALLAFVPQKKSTHKLMGGSVN